MYTSQITQNRIFLSTIPSRKKRVYVGGDFHMEEKTMQLQEMMKARKKKKLVYKQLKTKSGSLFVN